LDGTTTVAVVAIIGSVVVAPSLTALWQALRERRERRHELERELRGVLDEAAASLAKSRRTTQRLVRHWERKTPPGDPQVIADTAEQRETVEYARTVVDRLKLRLGSGHAMTATLNSAHEVLDEMQGIVMQHGGGRVGPYQERINKIGRDYTKAWDAFIEAAHEYVLLPVATKPRRQFRKKRAAPAPPQLPNAK
jgi:hypothetical protein